MLEQKDFERIAEIVSGSVMFQLNTSMLQLENRICDKLAGVENKLEERITQVETKFDERMTNLEVKYDNLDNDIDKKISILAEGNSLLQRKLDESFRVIQKQEMMDLHMIDLESKIREIKMQLGYPC